MPYAGPFEDSQYWPEPKMLWLSGALFVDGAADPDLEAPATDIPRGVDVITHPSTGTYKIALKEGPYARPPIVQATSVNNGLIVTATNPTNNQSTGETSITVETRNEGTGALEDPGDGTGFYFLINVPYSDSIKAKVFLAGA